MQERAVSPHDETERFLRGAKVQQRYDTSRFTILRWMKDEAVRFPKPIIINRQNFWRLSDLQDWDAKQVENV